MSAPLSIVTPCHGAPLKIYTAGTGGSGYLTYDEPSEIACPHENCHNSWNPDGTVAHWASGPS